MQAQILIAASDILACQLRSPLHSCMSELWERPLTQTLGEGITRLIVAFATWFDPRARRQCYMVFHGQDGEHGSPLWFWQVLNNAINQYRFQGVMEPDDFYENSGFYLGWRGSRCSSVRCAEQEMYMMSFNAFREERLGQL